MIRRLLIAGAALLLGACTTSGNSKFTDAAVAPLSDLNLVHAEIPPKLLAAQKQPYLQPADPGCEALTKEIGELDAVLGADLDTPPSDSNPGLIERGAVADAAAGALRHTTEGLVPFRGWVRKVTGAERYSKSVAAAIAAGTVRRAFLKGLRVAQKCEGSPPAMAPPAAPAT
jgi:hypothetical protein